MIFGATNDKLIIKTNLDAECRVQLQRSKEILLEEQVEPF